MTAVDRLEDDLAAILGLQVAELTARRTLAERLADRTPKGVRLAALVGTGAAIGIAIAVISLRMGQGDAPRLEAQMATSGQPDLAMTVTTEPPADDAPQVMTPPLRGSQTTDASPPRRRAAPARAPIRQARATAPRNLNQSSPHPREETPGPALALNDLRPSPRAEPQGTQLDASAAFAPTTNAGVGDDLRLARRERLQAIDEVRLLRQK